MSDAKPPEARLPEAQPPEATPLQAQPPVQSGPPPDFDAVYRHNEDPWQVSSSWYERRKLGVLLASLPAEHYQTAWEPGCGPGFTSLRLAPRASQLTCSDGSSVAIQRAADRCKDLSHVRCVVSRLPDVPLEATADLIVVAEFLYYVQEFEAALDALWSALAPGGHLVVMHWVHHPHDAYRSGLQMHAAIRADATQRDAKQLVAHLDSDFVLDVYASAS